MILFKNKFDINFLIKNIVDKKTPKLNINELLELRDCFYTEVLQKNDLPSKEYLRLIEIYKNQNLDDKKEFENYIKTADNFLNKCEKITEKLFLIHLKTTCLIFNSKTDEAMEYYISSFALLNYMEIPDVIEYLPFFQDYCKDISFDTYYDICKNLFEPSYYFSLSNLEQRNILNNNLLFFWNFANVFVNKQNTKIYELMKIIFYQLIYKNEYSKAMHITLGMLHIFTNVKSDMGLINNEIIKPLEKLYKSYLNNENLVSHHKKRHKKKRIGFLKDRIAQNSPYKVEYSLIKALMSEEWFANKYQIYIYSFSTIEKMFIDDEQSVQYLLNLGIKKISTPSLEQAKTEGFLYSYLKKALLIRNEIINDEIDILIDVIGSNPLAEFLFSTRSAKKQVYFSHGNEYYDIEDIDIKMSHCLPNTEFKLINIPMDNQFYNPPIQQSDIDICRALYPKDAFILGVITRLVKIDDDEYLKAVAEILNKNEKAIFLACGHGGDINRIKNKLENLGVLSRCYFPGIVDPHVYGHIIDLWLGTFPPYMQGESQNEYIAKGKIYVQLIKTKDYEATDEVKNIKNDPNKMLFYIKDYENLDKKNEIYRFMLTKANYYFVFNQREKDSLDNEILKKSIVLDQRYEAQACADYCFKIENGHLVTYDGFWTVSKNYLLDDFFIYKEQYPGVWNFMVRNADKLYLKKQFVPFLIASYTIKDYIDSACFFIQNKEYNSLVVSYIKVWYEEHNKRYFCQTAKRFENILNE